jgi:predicted DNA-binding ribbon-helix-helix protein
MPSPAIKRSVILHGHKTSVSLEEPFWEALREIAARKNLSVSALIAEIDCDRDTGNLSSAIRLFILHDFVARVDPALRFGVAIQLQPSKGRNP